MSELRLSDMASRAEEAEERDREHRDALRKQAEAQAKRAATLSDICKRLEHGADRTIPATPTQDPLFVKEHWGARSRLYRRL